MKKKLSIHDLAKQLGVSATAISFVINGKASEKGISDELKKRILDHIEDVGYKPNLLAQSLRTGKSKIIGMMVEDISDPFFSSIARGVEINAYEHGYKIFYVSTENDPVKTKALLKVFRERQVDGYIIAPPPGVETDIQSLLDDKLPVILFDRYLPDLTTHNVIVNNFQGSYKAVEHLQKNGFSNIGFVTLSSQQTQMRDRLEGYKQAVKDTNQTYILEIQYRSPEKDIVKKIKQFLTSNKKLDSVLFATNYLTSYGMKAINSLKLSVPEDIAIVSFDDNTFFELYSPSITAVAQPMEEISEKVVEKLMSCLNSNKDNDKKETVVLNAELIVRTSSKPLKKAHLINV
jgi:LacI family transcriptional regulator